jgi:hypothetical protein
MGLEPCTKGVCIGQALKFEQNHPKRAVFKMQQIGGLNSVCLMTSLGISRLSGTVAGYWDERPQRIQQDIRKTVSQTCVWSAINKRLKQTAQFCIPCGH